MVWGIYLFIYLEKRAWIRLIKDISFLKSKKIILKNEDILFTYTDWIIEAKNENGEIFGFNKLENTFLDLCKKYSDIITIEKELENILETYNWSKNFWDDVSIILLKKDHRKDIIKEEDKINEILSMEKINIKYKKRLKNKNNQELEGELKKIKKEEELKKILRWLDVLYKTWELPKLKQDCIMYIKEWFIDKKINFYLKKAIENENSFKLKQKEKKLEDKYNVLLQLYKSWDYETVINECSSIIQKEWNI